MPICRKASARKRNRREQTTDDTKTNVDYTDSTSRNDAGMGEAEAEAIAQKKANREAREEAEMNE